MYKCTENLRSRKAAVSVALRLQPYQPVQGRLRVCADCVGLIKGYCWTGGGKGVVEYRHGQDLRSKYGANNCPDKSANSMFSYTKGKGCAWG
ncbi:MAG: hypothetical protein ACLRRT_12885 [Ruthenibacterium lactatiformans]